MSARRFADIPDSMKQHLPADLITFLSQLESVDEIPVYEESVRNILITWERLGDVTFTSYRTPLKPLERIIYVFPGGTSSRAINKEEGLCSFLATTVNCLVICIDSPFPPTRQSLADIEAAIELTSLNFGQEMGISVHQIDLCGISSSCGSFPMAVTHMIRKSNGPSFRLLIFVVPLVDTNLETLEWMIQPDYPGLRKRRLHNELEERLPESDLQRSWETNPFIEAGTERKKMLGDAVFMIARFDPLYRSQLRTIEDLKRSGLPIKFETYDGIHQMKDLLCTEVGIQVRRSIVQHIRGH